MEIVKIVALAQATLASRVAPCRGGSSFASARLQRAAVPAPVITPGPGYIVRDSLDKARGGRIAAFF
ncbi:uncharacterized protein LY79DRAFT_558729 [Colletotrichum navitas]|uniref:Uncharacterized protein n=1 Tax=Colletotrichum navitas TaxID=681940 RepID=A0AAD8PV64_9PEZI|nr:uncharacterized protein LY79DRAFT_558729 [Colletotrichum navitas]KAK1585302.1 hypothetical protein LY79DRAFT_558729 [Colletotrichum navitas]